LEWGYYTPQSWALSLFFPFAYIMMYMSLTAAAVAGVGGFNLAVWASAAAAAALVFYAARNGAPFVGETPVRDVIAGAGKIAPLAIAMGVPLAWLFFAFYEARRMIERGAGAAGYIVFIAAALGLIWWLPYAAVDAAHLRMALEILLWPGVIGWEELISRFLLPIVGPVANYMFVALHAPSRWVEALFFAPAILAVISYGTRWITEVFSRHGLVGAIAAHAAYNAGVGWLFSLLESPLNGVLLLATLISARAAISRASALPIAYTPPTRI
jgi:hypothetical protein